MIECEWKDGKLWQCDNRPFMDCIPFKEWDFCPFCGADIRKPEEKPLIAKPTREEFLESMIDTYDTMAVESNNLNSKLMAELKKLRIISK